MYIPVYSWGYTETTTAIPSVGLQDLPLNLVVFAVGSAVFVSVLSLIFCCHLFKLRLKAQREMKKYNEVIRKEKAQHFDAYETCAVCLEDFKVKDKLGICPCRHAFHKKCLIRWLHIRKSCPLCISPIPLPGSSSAKLPSTTIALPMDIPAGQQALLPSTHTAHSEASPNGLLVVDSGSRSLQVDDADTQHLVTGGRSHCL
uniref:RING finger protein 24-like isoform X2 n=1 Tax=Myxine glutinosa TaxID=7769 RepID=UPI00358FBE8D